MKIAKVHGDTIEKRAALVDERNRVFATLTELLDLVVHKIKSDELAKTRKRDRRIKIAKRDYAVEATGLSRRETTRRLTGKYPLSHSFSRLLADCLACDLRQQAEEAMREAASANARYMRSLEVQRDIEDKQLYNFQRVPFVPGQTGAEYKREQYVQSTGASARLMRATTKRL